MARRDAYDRRRTVAFGVRVRAMREALGLTQEALAELADLHRAAIGFVERGAREVGITVAWRLAAGGRRTADGLGVSMAELVTDLA